MLGRQIDTLSTRLPRDFLTQSTSHPPVVPHQLYGSLLPTQLRDFIFRRVGGKKGSKRRRTFLSTIVQSYHTGVAIVRRLSPRQTLGGFFPAHVEVHTFLSLSIYIYHLGGARATKVDQLPRRQFKVSSTQSGHFHRTYTPPVFGIHLTPYVSYNFYRIFGRLCLCQTLYLVCAAHRAAHKPERQSCGWPSFLE